MGKSFSLGTFSGIPVRFHWTFALLLGWVAFSAYSGGASIAGAFAAVGFVLTVFVCVVLHEFGHAIAARRYGIGTRDITLLPIGGVAQLERMPRKPREEIVIALAGPAVNVAIALVVTGTLAVASLLSATSGPLFQVASRLLAVNIALVLFNLLPAFPMDGGRVLRALLAMSTDYLRATRTAARVGKFCALGFAFLGLSNPILFLIAGFIYVAGTAEARQVELRESLADLNVGDGMTRRFMSIPPDVYLRDVAAGLLESDQQRFPVLDSDGTYLGMLDREQLFDAIGTSQVDKQVCHVMTIEDNRVKETDSLVDTLERFGSRLGTTLAVTREGVLTGLLEIPRVFRLLDERLKLRESLGRRPSPYDSSAAHSALDTS